MPVFEQGEIIRVPFPYMDRATLQRRPAIIVSAGAISENQQLLWVAMITSAENRPWPGDVVFGDAYEAAGLSAPSVVRPCKIATIQAADAEKLGRAEPALLAAVPNVIARLLGDP